MLKISLQRTRAERVARNESLVRIKNAHNVNKLRVKGYQVYRPFVIGSTAHPIPTDQPRPANIPPEHTHRWTVYLKGVNDTDISHWLRKATFQLHETYANRTRTIDSPPFEVSETGWGEFEVRIQLYFVPEANEKAQSLWHAIKLHPLGNSDEEREEYRRVNKGVVVNEDYNEVVFSEPTEAFFDILTTGTPPVLSAGGPGSGAAATRGGKSSGGAGGRGGKSQQAAAAQLARRQGERSAEIPAVATPGNPYSQQTEADEVAMLQGKYKELLGFVEEEQRKLMEAEKKLEEVKKI